MVFLYAPEDEQSSVNGTKLIVFLTINNIFFAGEAHAKKIIDPRLDSTC